MLDSRFQCCTVEKHHSFNSSTAIKMRLELTTMDWWGSEQRLNCAECSSYLHQAKFTHRPAMTSHNLISWTTYNIIISTYSSKTSFQVEIWQAFCEKLTSICNSHRVWGPNSTRRRFIAWHWISGQAHAGFNMLCIQKCILFSLFQDLIVHSFISVLATYNLTVSIGITNAHPRGSSIEKLPILAWISSLNTISFRAIDILDPKENTSSSGTSVAGITHRSFSKIYCALSIQSLVTRSQSTDKVKSKVQRKLTWKKQWWRTKACHNWLLTSSTISKYILIYTWNENIAKSRSDGKARKGSVMVFVVFAPHSMLENSNVRNSVYFKLGPHQSSNFTWGDAGRSTNPASCYKTSMGHLYSLI